MTQIFGLKFVCAVNTVLLQVLTYLALGQHLIDANMVCLTKFLVSVAYFPSGELDYLLSQHLTVAFVRPGKTRYIRSVKKY